MMHKYLLLCWLAFASVPAMAKDCSYCAEVEKLQKEFSLVKPEPRNLLTIDHQNKLVDASSSVLQKALKNPTALSSKDWARVLPFLATVVKFDYQNLTADDLLPVLGKNQDALLEAVAEAEKSGQLKTDAADEIRTAFGTAAVVREDKAH
jgi:hypothetical protein